MSVIHNNTPMPFGAHAGKAMKDVPSGYLRYLQKSGNSTVDVLYYIENRLDKEKEEENIDLKP